MWPLYKKEARAYFNTPSAYVVIVVLLLISGYFFAEPLFLSNVSSLSAFTGILPLLLVFFVPAVTMRLFAEEVKSGTVEILMTLPIEDYKLLLAKYFAALTVILFALAGSLIFPGTLAALGSLDWGATFGTYAGLFFTAAVMAGMGLFASTLTKNQIVAFILGFLVAFVFYILGKIQIFLPLWLQPIATFAGIDSHLDNISRGILDSRDLIYYFSTAGFFLFLSYLQLNSKRWR
ncbi:MAG: ABC transporter permease subunit [Elusimicrobia bacterium]|nr:ABC transporter permease subunit [Elusimicrobiota bacterium]